MEDQASLDDNSLNVSDFDASSRGMSQDGTEENENGPCWIRTSDHQIMSPAQGADNRPLELARDDFETVSRN